MENQLILPVKYDFVSPLVFNYLEQSLKIGNNNRHGLITLKTTDFIEAPVADEDLSLPLI